MPRPRVLFADQAAKALKRGFDQMAELLAVTLGPTQGNILSERDAGGAPELLDDSATIARRVLEFPDQAGNVGAMLMRSMAWRAHLRAGDGVATTAVLSQAILREAFRYTQAGGNAMLMKRGLEQALKVALADLKAQARPVGEEEELTRVAQAITAEPRLSLVLGEMFDVLGTEAHITIEDYVAPYLERTYYDGGRWKAKVASPYLMTDTAGRRAVQTDCLVVLFAGRLEEAAHAQHVLELMVKSKKRNLLLAAYEIKGPALGLLVANHQQKDKDKKFNIVGVSLSRPGKRRDDDFADLALITGAKLLDAKLEETLADLTPADFGHVRRVVASTDYLIVSGGGGAPAERRETIQQLQGFMSRLPETDTDERDEVQLRLGRLAGGIGVLKVGAHSKYERKRLHQHAEKAIRSLRLAMAGGVAPGGGVAYLHAIPAVEQFAAGLEGDEQYGARILAQALEEPFRRIVQNRGISSPSVALAELRRLGNDYVYDAISDRAVPWAEEGLLDPVGVLAMALETAASGAMLALTTGAMVLHRKPEQSLQP